jgi:nucleotide-binding universal stress UspA family protein
MSTIIVGVDGSAASLRAMQFAADLASDEHDAEVVVVFARYAYFAIPDGAAEAMFADVLDRAESRIGEEAERLLGQCGLRWKLVVRDGEPAHVLCDVASELGARVIVVGRRGWSTVCELVIGSVSNRLVHRSHCTVLLVPD